VSPFSQPFSAPLLGVAYSFFTRPYAACVRLVLSDGSFPDRAELRALIDLATSPAIFANIASRIGDGTAAEEIRSRCEVVAAERGPMFSVLTRGSSGSSAVRLANSFAAEVVNCSDEWTTKRTEALDSAISAAQKRLSELHDQLTAGSELTGE
jgi:hypothetical protein